MTPDPIYLDFNATTPVAPEVLEAMMPFLGGEFGNPSSDHAHGRRARNAIDEARADVAELIGAEPDEVVFTSGGTESNNLAVFGTAAHAPQERRTIVTSMVEHPATVEPLAELGRQGWEVARFEMDDASSGITDAGRCITPQTALVTVILAQNETGAILPIRELADLAHAAGAVVHTDAAQAVGKIPVDVAELGVDLLSIAGHKLYAPKGVGALYVKRDVRVSPVMRGAGQEGGVRPGTENVPYIVGLGAAARLARHLLATEPARVAALRDRLWEQLAQSVPGIIRITPDHALPNTLLISFPSVVGATVLGAAGSIAASTGSACHAAVHEPSPVLVASGVESAVALGAVRLSLGRTTTIDHVDTASRALSEGYELTLQSG